MKTMISLLALVFSLSAASANETSAVEKVKAMKGSGEFCKSSITEIKGWSPKKPNSEQIAGLKRVLEGVHTPSEEELATIRTALKEDPSEAITPYFKLSEKCGMLLMDVSNKLISIAKAQNATAADKTAARTLLKDFLKTSSYQTYLEVMIRIAIFESALRSKVFQLPKSDVDQLAASKEHIRTQAKELQKKVYALFPELKSNPNFDMKAIKRNPNYEKNKGLWLEEIDHSSHVLMQLKAIAEKLN